MKPFSGNPRPDLLTSLMNMSFVFVLHLHGKCIFADPLQMSHACHPFWRCYKTFCSLLTRCTIPCTCHAKRDLNVQKWSERGVFCTCWLRNVLGATTACTFSTSNFITFQKWSEAGVFCTFWLGNVLRATTACAFSSLICPDGSAPAALASLLFDSPTFSRICIFFLLTLSLLSSSLFYSSLLSASSPSLLFICPYLSEVWLLNFLQ